MWFGVAPSNSPSRTNTQSWHPPLCTCARHRKATTQEQGKQQQELSPRAPHTTPWQQPVRSQSSRQSLFSRKKTGQAKSALEPHIHGAGPTMSAHAKTTSPGSPSVHDRAKLRQEEEGEPAASGHKEPEQTCDDDFLINKVDDSLDGNNGDEYARGTDVPIERKTPRSGRRASKVAEHVQNAMRSPTGHIDPPGAQSVDPSSSLAPPKSRRSSRTYFNYLHESSEGGSSRELAVASSLSTRLQPENLVGHTSSVCSISTKDDRFLVSCSIDGSVKVWSRTTFACLHTLFGHEDNVSCIDLNVRWLVSGSHDTTLRVYTCLDNFRCLNVLRGHTAHITNVHLPLSLPQHILSCSDDATIRIWNGELGHCVFVLRDHSSRITCFHIDGERVCSGAADAAICFWSVSDFKERHKNREIRATRAFHIHKATVQVLVSNCSTAGTLLVSGSSDGTIQIFDFQTMEYIGRLDHVSSPIYSMCLLADGKLVCSTGDGRLLQYSDLDSHPLEKSELRLATKWISMLQVRGGTLVCSSEDLLYIVDAEQIRVLAVIETMHGFVNSVGWLHSKALVSGGQDNVIKIWNIG